MTTTEKEKLLNLEDYQGGSREVWNKVFGNSATCSTAAATAAKEVTLGSTFNLVAGATLLVKFTNGISVASSTLAVTHTPLGSSTATTETAKPIYLNGAALEANVIPAGATIILRYNGTQFDVIGGAGSGETEVEIGQTTPTEDVKLFVDTTADPASSINVYNTTQVDNLLSGKNDTLSFTQVSGKSYYELTW